MTLKTISPARTTIAKWESLAPLIKYIIIPVPISIITVLVAGCKRSNEAINPEIKMNGIKPVQKSLLLFIFRLLSHAAR